MTFDDRMSRAQSDLADAFDEAEAPPFAAVRARQRRRRVAAGGVASLLLVAVGAVVVAQAEQEDPTVIANSTTVASTALRATTAPTGTEPATVPTTSSTDGTVETVPHEVPLLVASGPEPANAVAVRDDGALVRLRTENGEIAEEVARKGDPRSYVGAGEKPLYIASGAMTPTGRMFWSECCGVGAGAVYEAKKTGRFAIGDLPVLAPNGQRLAVYHRDLSDVRVLDVATGHLVRRLRVRPDVLASGEVTKLALANDGRVAVETFSNRASLAVYDATSTEPDHQLSPRPRAKDRTYTDPVFLPDGRLLVVDQRIDERSDVDDTAPSRLTALDAAGRVAGRLALSFSVADLAVSQTGHVLAIGTDHTLRVFDGRTWHELARGYTAADW
jgi:hypothetical protein